jgi:hypothetical protein
MWAGVNLRGDLAKLSDAEITAEFDRLLADRQKALWNAPSLFTLKGLLKHGIILPLGRGLIRGRPFYRLAVSHFWPFKNRLSALYLLDCELLDIRDEIERRVEERKKASAADNASSMPV